MATNRHVALLRGVNVGKNKRVQMAALRELLGTLGYADVKTLVNSGNAVLTSSKQPATLAKEIEKGIESEFGIDVQVLVRSRDELAKVVDGNPFPDQASEGSKLHVTFLSAAVTKRQLGDIDTAAFAPNRFELSGREIYLWTPNGMMGAADMLDALSEKRLGVSATTRNWNTVTKLLVLLDG
jgi:uncharacterized protein (DUF1697 family)